MKFKQKEKRVTIIVGIITREAISLACDSQSTTDNTKRTDTSKISCLALGGKKVLVAQAGDCTLSGRAVEIMQSEMAALEFDDYRKPADAAQLAVKRLKHELVDINNWQDTRDKEEEYLALNPFSLMIAYFYNDKPYIQVLNSVPGFATPKHTYAAIGCGGTIGEFILSRANVSKMNTEQGLVAAIYAVEEVKKVDTFCGGPTRAAFITPKGVLMSEEETKPLIKCAVDTLAAYESDLKVQWGLMIDDIIKKTNTRYKNSKK